MIQVYFNLVKLKLYTFLLYMWPVLHNNIYMNCFKTAPLADDNELKIASAQTNKTL